VERKEIDARNLKDHLMNAIKGTLEITLVVTVLIVGLVPGAPSRTKVLPAMTCALYQVLSGPIGPTA